MLILIIDKRDDIKSGTKANARHGQLRPVQESMGKSVDYFIQGNPGRPFAALYFQEILFDC